MLRLVHPPPSGQGPRPPKGRRAAIPLTDTEQQRVRAALRSLRASFGSWRSLAEALGVALGSLQHVMYGMRPVSAALALRVAKAAGKPLDEIIGEPSAADRCPRCGRSG